MSVLSTNHAHTLSELRNCTHYTCTHSWMDAHTHTRAHARTHTRTHACTRTHTHTNLVRTYISTRLPLTLAWTDTNLVLLFQLMHFALSLALCLIFLFVHLSTSPLQPTQEDEAADSPFTTPSLTLSLPHPLTPSLSSSLTHSFPH